MRRRQDPGKNGPGAPRRASGRCRGAGTRVGGAETTKRIDVAIDSVLPRTPAGRRHFIVHMYTAQTDGLRWREHAVVVPVHAEVHMLQGARRPDGSAIAKRLFDGDGAF